MLLVSFIILPLPFPEKDTSLKKKFPEKVLHEERR